MQAVPRITPTPEHLEALAGTWKLRGETVQLQGEENSGVLIALNEFGEQVNPMQVISQGVKVEEARDD